LQKSVPEQHPEHALESGGEVNAADAPDWRQGKGRREIKTSELGMQV
jgi:hypothetical protein